LFARFVIVVCLALNAPAQTAPPVSDIRVDAFDADAWNGIVFLAQSHGQPVTFGLRVGSRSGTYLDGSEIYPAVSEVGPHRPDGTYSRMSWRHPPSEARITLEWSRADAITVVGRLNAAAAVQLVLEAYLPRAGTSTEGIFSVSEADRSILGERYFDRLFGSTLKFLIVTDRPVVSAGTYASLDALRNSMRASGRLNSTSEPAAGVAGIEFSSDGSRTAHFVAILGSDEAELKTRARDWLAAGAIDALLNRNAERYSKTRPSSPWPN
jgi:hypothetical protein